MALGELGSCLEFSVNLDEVLVCGSELPGLFAPKRWLHSLINKQINKQIIYVYIYYMVKASKIQWIYKLKMIWTLLRMFKKHFTFHMHCNTIVSHFRLQYIFPFRRSGVGSVCLVSISMEPNISTKFNQQAQCQNFNLTSKTGLKCIASSKRKIVFLSSSGIAEVRFHLLKW